MYGVLGMFIFIEGGQIALADCYEKVAASGKKNPSHWKSGVCQPTGGEPNPAAKNQAHSEGIVGVGVFNLEALGCFESTFSMEKRFSWKQAVKIWWILRGETTVSSMIVTSFFEGAVVVGFVSDLALTL